MSKFKDADYQEFIKEHPKYNGFIVDTGLLKLVRAGSLDKDIYFKALQSLEVWWHGETVEEYQPENLDPGTLALFNIMLDKAKQGLERTMKESRGGKKYKPSEGKQERTESTGEKLHPSIEDVKEVFNKNGFNGDPEEFYNYYSVRGWTYEKTGAPIKDLEQVARAWSEKQSSFSDREGTEYFTGNWYNKLKETDTPGLAKDREDHTVLNDLK